MQNIQQKFKVLIGDNTMNLGVLCADNLLKQNYDVDLVPKNGLKVLEAARQKKPDVIVMETFMADLDALGVLHELKTTVAKMPKVIVLSGYDNKYIENEIMTNGANYYMIKPFDINALCGRIASVCGINSAESFHEQPDNPADDLEVTVTNVILNIGVPAHVKGYNYLRDAIILCINDPAMINAVTKMLYPTIAKKYATTSSRVERAIRHGIELAWDRGDVDTLNSYFGYTVNVVRGKPTNSEFIAMLSDKLRLQIRHPSAKASYR